MNYNSSVRIIFNGYDDVAIYKRINKSIIGLHYVKINTLKSVFFCIFQHNLKYKIVTIAQCSSVTDVNTGKKAWMNYFVSLSQAGVNTTNTNSLSYRKTGSLRLVRQLHQFTKSTNYFW